MIFFPLRPTDPDVFEFHIVSLDNKQWFFDATSAEERDEWVAAIEQQILSSLQVCTTADSSKLGLTNYVTCLLCVFFLGQ